MKARAIRKRVYRIRRTHGLLLALHTGKRLNREHDQKVVTLKTT